MLLEVFLVYEKKTRSFKMRSMFIRERRLSEASVKLLLKKYFSPSLLFVNN